MERICISGYFNGIQSEENIYTFAPKKDSLNRDTTELSETVYLKIFQKVFSRLS